MSEVHQIIQDFLNGKNDAGGTIARLETEVVRLEARIHFLESGKKVNDLCGWTPTGDEYSEGYETSCGEIFVIEAGTPEDNGFIYCTYCGRKIYEVVTPETEW